MAAVPPGGGFGSNGLEVVMEKNKTRPKTKNKKQNK